MVKMQYSQAFQPPRRPLRDDRHCTTDCSVPGSVRQAAVRQVQPGAGKLRRRGGPAQGGRARVRVGQGVRPVPERQARAGEDSAHARGPDRPAHLRHRLRPSRLQRCRAPRRRPHPQAAARPRPGGGRVTGLAADAVAVRERSRPRRALRHGVRVGGACCRAPPPPATIASTRRARQWSGETSAKPRPLRARRPKLKPSQPYVGGGIDCQILTSAPAAWSEPARPSARRCSAQAAHRLVSVSSLASGSTERAHRRHFQVITATTLRRIQRPRPDRSEVSSGGSNSR